MDSMQCKGGGKQLSGGGVAKVKVEEKEGRKETEVCRTTERTAESVVVGKVGLLLLLAASLSGVPISEMSVH